MYIYLTVERVITHTKKRNSTMIDYDHTYFATFWQENLLPLRDPFVFYVEVPIH